MLALKIIGICVAGYFLGNINFAIIISRILHSDVRNQGSGNPGTMNMLRSYGILPGIVCLFFDAFKAAVPTFFGWWLIAETPFCYTNLLGAYVGGLSAVIGHVFPVLLKFKGGKGVATIVGISLVLTPAEALGGILVAIIIILIVKIGSLGSFAAILIPGIAQAVYMNVNYAIMENLIVSDVLLFLIVFLCFFAHRSNIARLFRGKENKVYLFKKKTVESEPGAGSGEEVKNTDPQE